MCVCIYIYIYIYIHTYVYIYIYICAASACLLFVPNSGVARVRVHPCTRRVRVDNGSTAHYLLGISVASACYAYMLFTSLSFCCICMS